MPKRTFAAISTLGFLVLGAISLAEAQSYDYGYGDRPYRGWHADMERHERRQTELMEMQEERERRREEEYAARAAAQEASKSEEGEAEGESTPETADAASEESST